VKYISTGAQKVLFVDWPLWMTDTNNPASGLQGLFAANFFQNIVFPNSGWTPSSFSAAENAKQADTRKSLYDEAEESRP
jgi:feruloyl esterase